MAKLFAGEYNWLSGMDTGLGCDAMKFIVVFRTKLLYPKFATISGGRGSKWRPVVFELSFPGMVPKLWALRGDPKKGFALRKFWSFCVQVNFSFRFLLRDTSCIAKRTARTCLQWALGPTPAAQSHWHSSTKPLLFSFMSTLYDMPLRISAQHWLCTKMAVSVLATRTYVRNPASYNLSVAFAS